MSAALLVFVCLILSLVPLGVWLATRFPAPTSPASSRLRIGWTGWIGRLTWVVDFRYSPNIEARRTLANVWCVSFGPFRIAWERTLDVLTERTMVNWGHMHLMLADLRAERRKVVRALQNME